jgi:hypothetical protein
MTATTQLAGARLSLNGTQCEALFASVLQPSDTPTADMVQGWPRLDGQESNQASGGDHERDM